ncbi:MAG: cellulose binding domain-containing protein [Lachnospiraceae bacterium]|nr:cellulose binding domain-containing protein [Lachnospiraceae bacterium]
MGNTTKVNKHRNRLIAVMLVISLFTGILPIHVSASAYETNMQNGIYTGLTHTYKADGYSVELSITDVWQGACNAHLVIKNTGETIIDNWALAFDTGCEITNIWNAVVSEKAIIYADFAPLYKYTVKNAGHNKDIPVGAQVEIGFSMNIPADLAAVIIPSSFSMAQKTIAISDDLYTVYSFIYGDTNNNYNGCFVIKNDSDTTIEDWVLGFTTDIDVIDFHTAELIER